MFARTAEHSFEAAFDSRLPDESGIEARSHTRLSSTRPRMRHIAAQAQMKYPGCLLGRPMCRGRLACLGIGWLCGNAMQGARPHAPHPLLLITRVGRLWFWAFVLASGAAPILGPWPRAKQGVAFRRHAEFDQQVNPKTGPFFAAKCHACRIIFFRSACTAAGG